MLHLLMQSTYGGSPSGGGGGGTGGGAGGAVAGIVGLLMLIPFVNLIWLLVFAFSQWPIHRELERYRQQIGYAGGGFPVGQPPPSAMPPPPVPMR